MDVFGFSPLIVMGFLLTLMRVSIVLFLLPIFSTQNVPVQVKAAISLVLTLGLWPHLSLPATAIPHPFTMGVMLLGEAVMGLTLGLAVNVLFMGIQAGGELLGFQMGFTMINFADPLTGNQTGATAFFLWMVSLLVFLTLDGHLYLLKGFAASFKLVPPGALFIGQAILDQMLYITAQIFVLAVKIAAPVIVALFMVEVALALISRTSPQIHIMEFGFPVKICVGFLFVGMLLLIMSEQVSGFINGMDGLFTNLLGAMAPGAR
ncbi:MAG: flagellar biosynthetic protein FliR [Desulfovibrio sp.]|jgi:flagellar biosynthetic protein FliR|nr:flagellar biosynthetic protein FliR [Desulfovibrio sp.]